MEIFLAFSDWLNGYLAQGLPAGIVALHFNLYEGTEQTYNIELVGCGKFDANNEDWVCNELFTTRDNLFCIPRVGDIHQWEQGLLFATNLVKTYLNEGSYADTLKSYRVVGIGFVDGDIEIVFPTHTA